MDDFKDQIFGKVTGDLDVFKKILSKVPGFQGYIERQKRRDSDRLIRDTIFQRFRELEGRVSLIERDIDIRYADDLEASAIKLRTFADRVHTAARGYSGLFDAVKVGEDELTRMYDYDAALLDLVDDVGRAIDNVEASIGSEGLPAALRNLESVSRQAIETYDRREEIVRTGSTGMDLTATNPPANP